MSATDALAALAARLSEALHHPVSLGTVPVGEGPSLSIHIRSMSPVPDVSKMTGRHVADQKAGLAWVLRLVLKGEAEGLLAQVRMVEAAALEIEGRPVMGGNDWRADMVLEQEMEGSSTEGASVGVRLRVASA